MKESKWDFIWIKDLINIIAIIGLFIGLVLGSGYLINIQNTYMNKDEIKFCEKKDGEVLNKADLVIKCYFEDEGKIYDVIEIKGEMKLAR